MAWLRPSKVLALQVSTLPSDPAPLQDSLDAHLPLGSGPSEYSEGE